MLLVAPLVSTDLKRVQVLADASFEQLIERRYNPAILTFPSVAALPLVLR